MSSKYKKAAAFLGAAASYYLTGVFEKLALLAPKGDKISGGGGGDDWGREKGRVRDRGAVWLRGGRGGCDEEA